MSICQHNWEKLHDDNAMQCTKCFLIANCQFEDSSKTTMKPFDPKKPCQTRDGKKVIIYCVDAPGEYQIHGRIEDDNYPRTWRLDGRDTSLESTGYDLVNIQQKVEKWANVYTHFRTGYLYPTKSEADRSAEPDRIACIKVSFEEGEGL